MERSKGYYKFSEYLKERFGDKVFKVSVDAGFSCPNRDGTKGTGGCIFCDNRGFSFNTISINTISTVAVESQIENGMEFARKRYNAGKYIIYFQAYTNTYAPAAVLREKYDIVKKFDNIVGISIGTRPDCVDDEILDLIQEYTGNYEVWIEYGLQSIHEKTLKRINRNHSYEDFLNAVELTRKRKNIKICAHVIIGLPGETRMDIIDTAKELGRIKVDGVKIHPMHVIRETKLEEDYKKELYQPLDLDEYMELAVSFLEYLYPDTVIQRLTADCSPDYLTAPYWINDKNKVLSELGNILASEERYQGRLYEEKGICNGG